MVICLERDADLHMARLMPLPLTFSCFSKIQIGFTFLVPSYPGSPGQRAIKWVCVCVCFLLRDAIKASIKLTHQRAALLRYLQSCCCRCRETVSWTAAALCPAWKLSWTSLLQDRETPSKLTRRGESNSSWERRPVALTANRWHYMPPRFVVSETSRCSYSCYFASAAVAVDSSQMTASSPASWGTFSPPSNFVNNGTCRQCGWWSVTGHNHWKVIGRDPICTS